VEVDGGVHESQKYLDEQRQQLLESLGLRFVRVSSEEVERNLAGVLSRIRGEFGHPHPPLVSS
jgi:very-short-patch-repair endonuclease